MAQRQGRFHSQLDSSALRFSSSLHIDKRLFHEDIEGSVAHVLMLAKQRIIPSKDAAKIRRGLRQIEKEIERGQLPLTLKKNGKRFVADDIHMAIEERLIRKIGPAGGKLHTARSRNDQVALDERLFLRKTIDSIRKAIRSFQRACVSKAFHYRSVIMPGYTHLQRAQPILLAHHLLAYVSMLERDFERFGDCAKRVNRSPLGAGALAGSSFPIDRNAVARTLRFTGVIDNSIDAVSDRDVQIEFLGACAITMMHLSRFAEELVLWSSHEWDFVEIGEAFTTGSSIMPQKKNPDMAELIRGKTGRVYGDLIALLSIMKGLPLAYNRDMQEDKEPLFDASDTLMACLEIFAPMVATLKFDRDRFEGDSDFLLATELADYLVRKRMPFRQAHAIVGGIVRQCVEKGIALPALSLNAYRKHSPLFDKDLWKILHVRQSVLRKKSNGSTSPKEVHKAILRWKRILAK